MSINWSEKRRDKRLDLSLDRFLTVHLLSQNVGSDTAETLVAQVRNVSVRGCGLIFSNASDRERLGAKKIFLISLVVDGFSIPIQVEVVRLIGDKEAAVKFKAPYPRELEKLERFLEPRFLGKSLREIDPSKLQRNQQKDFRWFQGTNETHLYSWGNPGEDGTIQQQLVFLDWVVEWKGGGSAQTGTIRRDERSKTGDVGWVVSELLDFDAVPDPTVLKQAKILIESSTIEEKIKKEFLKRL
ncbi:MAG: hypothetical protein KCHDKBKB_00225 [Elusimicrobia bacterium]|nr:hypothetical protein [Elusimicrobiota bacterium]